MYISSFKSSTTFHSAVGKQLHSIQSTYEMNPSNEPLSMNVFQMQGMTFIPDAKETVSRTEKVMLPLADTFA
jgi:hypothetical protein